MALVSIVLFFIVFYLVYQALKFPRLYNDGLYVLIGKKRSGKTTFLAAASIYYYLRRRPVYSTCALPCSKLISKDDIGFVQFPKYSVILLDEIGILFNNRKFKTFPPEVMEYFKLQGHYKHLVIAASQALDFDISIQRLIDMVGIVDKTAFNFSRIRWGFRHVDFNKSMSDENSSPVIDIIKPAFPLFGGWFFIYRPLFYPFFDSYEAPELQAKKFSVPAGMRHKFERKRLHPVLAFWKYRINLSFPRKRKETAQISPESVSSPDDVSALPLLLDAPTPEKQPEPEHASPYFSV